MNVTNRKIISAYKALLRLADQPLPLKGAFVLHQAKRALTPQWEFILDEEQKAILGEDPMDTDRFEANLNEKGSLIDELNLLDDGFKDIYERIREEITGNREFYKEEIKRMQELISAITERSVTVRAEEERNRAAAQKQFSGMRNELQSAKRSQQAANTYYSNMSRLNFVDAQFMDKRK